MLSRHAKNRLRRYSKYGVTAELVIQMVEHQVAAGTRGDGMAFLTTDVGAFRIAFVAEDRATTIKTIMPPRRGRF